MLETPNLNPTADQETSTTATDALKSWSAPFHHMIETRKRQVKQGDPKLTYDRLAQLVTDHYVRLANKSLPKAESPAVVPIVNGITIADWANGRSAPESPALHRALMHALGMLNTVDADRRSKNPDALPLTVIGIERGLAAKRLELEQLYAAIPEADRKPGIAVTEIPANKIQGARHADPRERTRHTATSSIYMGDTVIYSDPLLPGWVSAQKLDLSPQEILNETENAAEFFRAACILSGFTQLEVAQKLGGASSGVSYTQSGKTMPSSERVEAILSFLKMEVTPKLGWDAAARYETLVIQNRLAIIEHCEDLHRTCEVMGYMPMHYWHVALQQRNQDAQWNSGKIDIPSWAADKKLITTRGHYLRALRYAYGLSPNEVGDAVGERSDAINHREAGARPITPALLEFYKSGAARVMAEKKAAALGKELIVPDYVRFSNRTYNKLSPVAATMGVKIMASADPSTGRPPSALARLTAQRESGGGEIGVGASAAAGKA